MHARRSWLGVISVPGDLGFTLIELLTVLAVGGIILSLALPRFTGLLATLSLDHAARRLVRDLHFARAGAQARGERYTVRFVDDGYIILRGETRIDEVNFPPRVSLDAVVATREIWFSPAGYSSGGFVTLRSETGRVDILVPAASGHAYIVPTITAGAPQ
ncbi:MAG: GspH/FimT family pseudopilin [Armatimonadetes bacterium]|nr:GspH/FimT family pseudopilin [Armatimonadota bacterium]